MFRARHECISSYRPVRPATVGLVGGLDIGLVRIGSLGHGPNELAAPTHARR